MTSRALLLVAFVALVLGGAPSARAQVFLASRPHPEFAIDPLLVVASVGADAALVTVRVSWSLLLLPNRAPDNIAQDLYLLWPAEVAGSTVAGPADPSLRRFVQERGFMVVSEGRLALGKRDRGKLGTPAENDPIGEVASFVTFYKSGTAPAQSGVGTYIKIPWTPLLTNPGSLVSLTMTSKDLISPKPATWLEEFFWGRRQVLTLNAGGAGSVALYSLYFDQRDRVVRLGRDLSLLVANFADADHLRIEDVSPASATRRPSRVRAGTETVTLPLSALEGLGPQVLRVQFSYFSGRVAWRPILVSLLFLVLGNLMGAFMFTQAAAGFFRARFHLGRGEPPSPRAGAVLPASVLEQIIPGTTTHAEVQRLCRPPDEEREQRSTVARRTLIFRETRAVPHLRFKLGWFSTVSHWDEEHHEVEIAFNDGRVADIQTRVRRSRPRPEVDHTGRDPGDREPKPR